MSEPFQNRCQKCIVFRHRFFQDSTSILHPLGPPTWSQNHNFGFKISNGLPFWTILCRAFSKNCVREGSKLNFGGCRTRFWKPQASISKGLEAISSRFSNISWHRFFEVVNADEPRMTRTPRVIDSSPDAAQSKSGAPVIPPGNLSMEFQFWSSDAHIPTSLSASGLQTASAGCAKRKQCEGVP